MIANHAALEPRKNVSWADCRIVDKRSHSDMNESAVADDGIKQRTAETAMRVMAVLFAENHELVRTLDDTQFVARNACEGFER